ncbi:hypothetical protein B0T17DRAFT_269901 [Bombardia bombarda]|uniref:Uncharacterized protein n=1 Tax=Bombardia bombarda TaxID=252184 RepID=A0AA39X1M7_9PEZI|nr:hypothetical protein B0T17DRAFT_269901 [Bombardia bombarda]
MAKRPLDIASPIDIQPEKPRRTERSHEENQERAYIAASRRSDRSLEARVQSAKMASDIHKKRTGKGFKISEEIVMKEEMYEEEEDDMPRQFRVLASHLQTGSSDMNNRLNAYLTNHVAMASMASMAREAEVNRLFAEQFPNIPQVAHQNSMYMQPLRSNQPGHQPSYQAPAGYPPPGISYSRERNQSLPQFSPVSQHQHRIPSYPSPTSTRHTSMDGQISPTALTPGSVNSSASGGTAISHPLASPYTDFSQDDRSPKRRRSSGNTSVAAINHSLSMTTMSPTSPPPPPPSASSFTSELPAESKYMANIQMEDPLASYMLNGGGELWGPSNPYSISNPEICSTFSYNLDKDAKTTPPQVNEVFSFDWTTAPADHYADTTLNLSQYQVPSRIGTPGGSKGDNWEDWVDMKNVGNDEDWSASG